MDPELAREQAREQREAERLARQKHSPVNSSASVAGAAQQAPDLPQILAKQTPAPNTSLHSQTPAHPTETQISGVVHPKAGIAYAAPHSIDDAAPEDLPDGVFIKGTQAAVQPGASMERNVSRLITFIGHMIREFTALILAALIIYFFYFNSSWSPPAGEIASYAFGATYLLILYLAIQTGGIALTGVPNAMAMATDAIVSVVPLLPLIYGMVDYFRGGLELSSFQILWAYAALFAILFDIVINLTIMIRLSRRYLGEIGDS